MINNKFDENDIVKIFFKKFEEIFNNSTSICNSKHFKSNARIKMQIIGLFNIANIKALINKLNATIRPSFIYSKP